MLRRALIILAHAALCALLPAATVEERLQLLEETVAALRSENAALKKQVGAAGPRQAVAAASPSSAAPAAAPAVNAMALGKETKLAIGGFVQTNAEFGDAADARFPAADRFLIRRARLGVKAAYAEGFEMVLQSDWGAASLNSTSGFRAQLTDVTMTYTRFPAANVAVGQFKVPYGYDQMMSDTKVLTVERTMLTDQLSMSRQVGSMVSGCFFEKRLGYAVAVCNGNGTNVSFNDNDQFIYIGRLYGTPVSVGAVKLNAAVNAFTSRDTASGFTGRRTGAGADLQAYVGNVEIDAEMLRTEFNRDVGVDYTARGWSVMGAYSFTPKLQGLFRYERIDPDAGKPGDQTVLRTIGITYLLKGDDLKFQVNYLIGNPPGAAVHRDRLLGRAQIGF